MNIDQAFASKYLKSEDIVKPVKVTVADCVMEEVSQGEGKPKESRAILVFHPVPFLPNRERTAMVLNATNANTMKGAFGNDTDAWIGQQIGVYVDPNIAFGGKIVAGLRIKSLVPVAEPDFDDVPAAVPAAATEEFDDDIPF